MLVEELVEEDELVDKVVVLIEVEEVRVLLVVVDEDEVPVGEYENPHTTFSVLQEADKVY